MLDFAPAAPKTMTSLLLFDLRTVIVWPCLVLSALLSLTISAATQEPPSLTPGYRLRLHSVLSKSALNPPLRSPRVSLRFSPDGKYLLFQDPSGVAVLSSEPLKILFHISAYDLYPARFSSDSQQTVFVSQTLSFATYSLPDGRKLVGGTLPSSEECAGGQIAPAGELFACITPDFKFLLFNLNTQKIVFEDSVLSSQVTPTIGFPSRFSRSNMFLSALDTDSAFPGPFGLIRSNKPIVNASHSLFFSAIHFSPDGKIVVAPYANSAFGLDVAARKRFDFSWATEKAIGQAFDLQSADRAVLSETGKHAKSAIVSLKTGKPIAELNFLTDEIHLATNTRYAILSDFSMDSASISAFDLAQNILIEAPPSTAMDIFGDVLAVRTEFGSIVLYRLSDHRLLRSLRLLPSSLPILRAASVSPNLEALALSVDGTGALYQLSNGQRITTTQKFSAGHFSANGDLFVLDHPRHQFPSRVLRLDHSNGSLVPAWEADKRVSLHPSGSVALEYFSQPSVLSPRESVELQLQVPFRLRGLTLSNGAELWKKEFSLDPPTPFANPQGENFVLGWRAKSSGAKSAAGKYPVIKNTYKNAKLNDLDSFFEVLDSKTGKSLGGALVQAGSGALTFDGAFAEGDALILIKDVVRISIYSLTDGKLKVRLVGLRPSASTASNLLALNLERGHLGIFDLMTGARLDEMAFGEDIACTHFSVDGQKLFLLTESQLAFVLDVSEVRKNRGVHPQ